MHFHIEQRFLLPMTAVESALSDPRFIERMAALPNLGHPQLLLHEVDGDTVHQQVRYAFAGELSSAVRAVVDPDQLSWIEDSVTDRATHRAVFTILPDHYATMLHCAGTFVVSPDGPSASVRVAEGEMKVSVPFVGGKVERAIISGLDEHAQAEVGLVEEWIAGAPTS
ncbi:MAG: hypothetical protein NVS3B12_20160 [Acidimicrobiales bacterium]